MSKKQPSKPLVAPGAPAPLAYSYVRFSSAKQASGDSLRRQHTKAATYAAENGLRLDESLSLRDLGVSAYDRSNVTRGALGVFLDALRKGKIPQGSYLLVEQLDRLSRATPLKAMDVLREIVEAGVNVVTLSDGRILTRENVGTLESVMMSFLVMSRAHEESERKSDMLSAFWSARRDLRPPVFTRECPRWLVAREDRTGYDVIQDRADSVRRVYELCANGYGNVVITRRANAEKWPVPGTGNSWHPTLITRLLNNRAVLGEYQPYSKVQNRRLPKGDPWPDYYPAIIDETLFNLAQSARATRKALPRRRDARYLNVFQGVLRCACGSSFSRKYKGSQAQPGYVQYQCTDRIRNMSDCPSVSALRLHPPLLRAIYEGAFVSVAQDDFIAWARDEVVAAEIKLADERQRLQRLLDSLENEDEDSPSILLRIRQREQSIRELTATLTEKRGWLTDLTNTVDAPALEGDLQEALSKLIGDEHIDFRASLHERITRVVSSIVVNSRTLTATISWRTGAADTVVSLKES